MNRTLFFVLYFLFTLRAEEATKFCTSCALRAGQISCIGGVVAVTQHFIVWQDYTVPIPGFMIITSLRHIQGMGEFTADERSDFIELLYQVRRAMEQALGIKTVYIIQEEDASHFHVWLFPRYEWMQVHGTKIKSVKPIMIWAKEYLNISENIRKVEQAAHALRDYMRRNHESAERGADYSICP